MLGVYAETDTDRGVCKARANDVGRYAARRLYGDGSMSTLAGSLLTRRIRLIRAHTGRHLRPTAEACGPVSGPGRRCFMAAMLWQGAPTDSIPNGTDFAHWDGTTMTQEDLHKGRMTGQIGISPPEPVEFAVLRFGRSTYASARLMR